MQIIFLNISPHLSLLAFVGHAKIIDKYLSNPLATYHDTVCKDKILFLDEHAEDPDWKVKQCYLLIIAAATEVVVGVDNLWKSGPSTGRHNYPDFGQYIPKNYFKAFCSAAPYAWAEEMYWYEDMFFCLALTASMKKGKG